MIRFHNISKKFRVGHGLWQKKTAYIHALRDVNLELLPQKTMGIVGESGSGKSTLARIFLGLYQPDSGYVAFGHHIQTYMQKKDWHAFRRQVGMVFQDPYSSLNPRMSTEQILREPLVIHRKSLGLDRQLENRRIRQVLDWVNLSPSALGKYPHEFSGGQRQRIGIARALVLEPRLLVLDEPVSALDVSIQAQILNLLADLKQQLNISYLFIAHDLGVIEYISDQVAVMYLGSVVEMQPANLLFKQPRHPYTRTLLRSMPDVSRIGQDFYVAGGEIPSPLSPPPGCAFAPRCSEARELCHQVFPGRSSHKDGFFHCHYPLG